MDELVQRLGLRQNVELRVDPLGFNSGGVAPPCRSMSASVNPPGAISPVAAM